MTHPHHTLAHSHSALVFRMDELEAHARGLAEANDDLGPLLEGLHENFAIFSDDLVEHIEHEERDIFPDAASAGLIHHDHAETLRNEHMGLHRCLERIRAHLGALTTEASTGERERLVREIAALRNAFVRHASAERSFLGAAEQASCQTA